jgi:hypothetical protein
MPTTDDIYKNQSFQSKSNSLKLNGPSTGTSLIAKRRGFNLKALKSEVHNSSTMALGLSKSIPEEK